MRGFAARWVVLVVAVAAWQVAAGAADNVYFPTPWQIAHHGFRLWFTGDTLSEDILPSLARVLGGWAIAAVLGVALGTALGRTRTGMHYVGALFAFFRAMPSPALLPVFIVLAGLDNDMKLALIAFGCVWPVLLNTVDGARSVDQVKTDTARSYRIPRVQWVTMVVLPTALPKIFAGLRLSLAIAVILMVVSEMVGDTTGIGYRLRFAQTQFAFLDMWSWITLLGIIGYGLNTALLAVERQALHWNPNHADHQQARRTKYKR